MKSINMLHIRAILAILCSLFLVAGCATTQSNDSNPCLTLCYQQYQIALQECESFLSYESRLEYKDPLMIKCLNNKGFSRAVDSCENKCLKQ